MVQLPLGTESISVNLPNVKIAQPTGNEAVEIQAALVDAISNPHGEKLQKQVSEDDTIAIVTTDRTRSTPTETLVSALIERLNQAGVAKSQITIVVGTGLHAELSSQELNELLGSHAELAVNHDVSDVVTVGQVDGVPVEVNPVIYEADTVITTGIVEPHQYAGFSGGAKTVVIGAGGEELIRYTHGPKMLDRDGIRLGRIMGNPFREAINKAGDLIGIDFCVNITRCSGNITGVSAGDHTAVLEELASTAQEALAVPIKKTYDTVIAGIDGPKDKNLYQASRAATYIALGAVNPLKENGTIIVPARLENGAGHGAGEQRFYRELIKSESPEALYNKMKDGYDPGAQRAFVLSQVLQQHTVTITNSEHPQVVTECHMEVEESINTAIDTAADILIVPDAINTLLIPKK
ncbi:lactate racemase domain-containing protein [Salinarchaeum sp. IM2453]|uniref:lactate racemase domain-containing protein n=1 Tax=Salinarchaeum sp. IM2453 TaxID=2862870 RepID=UPI001C83421A|nr:lactate racemase domain-containing protein [Salinarchaeum sp. IM2453]QZA87691.1 lactate racemase domain-containing protein [Salinarchaeum sp. IM2453]